MARRLPLKSVPINPGVTVNGTTPEAVLAWGPTMQAMLRFAPPGQGLCFDEVVRSVEALAPLEQALADGAEFVTLTDRQWQTLCDRLNRFPFSIADKAIVEMGRAILGAAEIT